MEAVAVLVVVALAVAALPLAVRLSARGSAPLARIGVEDGELVVRPRGLHQWWSLRRVLQVPVAAVADIGVARAADLPVGVRAPGTSVPGYRAGSYGTGADRSFWLVRRREEVLVVELRDRPYRRFVLEVDDPEVVVSSLRAQLRRARRSGRGH
ncbi:MAG TPA: hypothetical protein VM264_00965 [Acidimicrobiales bacterium]|nr:hypothetical protein [Acidimicrobiales bacterium]